MHLANLQGNYFMCAKFYVGRNFLYHFECNWASKQYKTPHKNLQMTQTKNNSKVKLAVKNLCFSLKKNKLNLHEYEADKLLRYDIPNFFISNVTYFICVLNLKL